MTSQDQIDALEREARLTTPVARKGGAGRPLAYLGLGLVGAVAMSWTLGGAAGGPGRMTDPSDEDWVVSAAVLQMPGGGGVDPKRGERIVLDDPAATDSDEAPAEDATPMIETFVPPTPDVTIAAPKTDGDGSDDDASAENDLRGERDADGSTLTRQMASSMPPFQRVARLPTDDSAIAERPRLPIGMAERTDEPPLDDGSADIRLPAGMPRTGQDDHTVSQTGEGEPGTDDGRWTRYRSEMVVFDQSDPNAKDGEISAPQVIAASPASPALGLFPGDPDR